MTIFINLSDNICSILNPKSPFIVGEEGAHQIADLSEVKTVDSYLDKYLIQTLPSIDTKLYVLPQVKYINTTVHWEALEDGTIIHHQIKGYETVEHLPEQKEGVIYITSYKIVELAKRPDIVCPIYIKDPINKNIIGIFSYYTCA